LLYLITEVGTPEKTWIQVQRKEGKIMKSFTAKQKNEVGEIEKKDKMHKNKAHIFLGCHHPTSCQMNEL
jgi:hypothetical protein